LIIKGKVVDRVLCLKKGSVCIYLHKPHPQKEVKRYQLKQVVEILEREGLI